jgi:hypothetical protein
MPGLDDRGRTVLVLVRRIGCLMRHSRLHRALDRSDVS